MIPGRDTWLRAVTAGLHLCRTLKTYNEERGLPWTSQLHARVAIAPSWKTAVACLSHCWRDEIVLDHASLEVLPPEQQRLLLFSGVRVGTLPEKMSLSHEPSQVSRVVR